MWWNSTSYLFESSLYMTRLYSKALTAEEVATNYAVGYLDTVGMVRESLKFCFLIRPEFMSTNYDTFYDLSGNGYNAWIQYGNSLDTMAWQSYHIHGVK